MKEAIANAGVFNLIIIFVVILIAFFVGSLGYSKAFKVKNRIIDEIEKDQCYYPDETNGNCAKVSMSETTQDRIDKWLGSIGYRVNTDKYVSCPIIESDHVLNGGQAINKTGDYQYCIYKFNTCSGSRARCGTYYRVIAYMYFDVPIVGDLIRIPVVGETITFTELNS